MIIITCIFYLSFKTKFDRQRFCSVGFHCKMATTTRTGKFVCVCVCVCCSCGCCSIMLLHSFEAAWMNMDGFMECLRVHLHVLVCADCLACLCVGAAFGAACPGRLPGFTNSDVHQCNEPHRLLQTQCLLLPTSSATVNGKKQAACGHYSISGHLGSSWTQDGLSVSITIQFHFHC